MKGKLRKTIVFCNSDSSELLFLVDIIFSGIGQLRNKIRLTRFSDDDRIDFFYFVSAFV